MPCAPSGVVNLLKTWSSNAHCTAAASPDEKSRRSFLKRIRHSMMLRRNTYMLTWLQLPVVWCPWAPPSWRKALELLGFFVLHENQNLASNPNYRLKNLAKKGMRPCVLSLAFSRIIVHHTHDTRWNTHTHTLLWCKNSRLLCCCVAAIG
jgi:hypothetical protein